MLLARQGHSVLVVDRATFPSDTLSTHFITQEGSAMLQDWGLLDAVMATGVPPVKHQLMRVAGHRMPVEPTAPFAICPRRTILDKLLVDAAAAAGAEVRQGFTVDEVPFEDGRVAGIRGRDRDRAEVTERAHIVIGADGKDSVIARAVEAPEYNTVPNTTCGYYAYFSGFEAAGVELYLGGKQALFVFPTNDGLTCLGVERPADQLDDIRRDPEASMQLGFDTVPGLGERMRAATRIGKPSGFAGRESFYRKPWGPGWALAGDAGHHKDPLMGQGMTDAFRDAGSLAAAIDHGLSGRVSMDEALATFQTNRDTATAMMYQITNMLAKDLDPAPETAQMLAMGLSSQSTAPAKV